MIVLEEPYVSPMLLKFLEEIQIPVLRNDFVAKVTGRYPKLNILDGNSFIQHYCSLEYQSLYTVSEYALDWVYQTLPHENLIEQVRLLKDKALFRKACSSIYEDLYFQEVSIAELFDFDITKVSLPVVLKPSIGFLSAGVYTITNICDWKEALEDIRLNFIKRSALFSNNVVGHECFIIESYIAGREFAIDLYFNGNKPVIVNLFEHLFVSKKDVSDRLYCTSKALFDKYLEVFTIHITKLNHVLKLSNIPVHIELRVENNRIVPIEINPLRFAGLCLNELHQYITGIHPLSYYFSKTMPDYQAMWKGKESQMFCFSVFEKSKGNKIVEIETIESLFLNILEIRNPNNPNLNVSALIFSKTDIYNKAEIDNILKFDVKQVKEYV
jgi:hypothetical protein